MDRDGGMWCGVCLGCCRRALIQYLPHLFHTRPGFCFELRLAQQAGRVGKDEAGGVAAECVYQWGKFGFFKYLPHQ